MDQEYKRMGSRIYRDDNKGSLLAKESFNSRLKTIV